MMCGDDRVVNICHSPIKFGHTVKRRRKVIKG